MSGGCPLISLVAAELSLHSSVIYHYFSETYVLSPDGALRTGFLDL